jgi:VanZ family protein
VRIPEAVKELFVAFSRRRKVVLTALLVYWPAIFVVTHWPRVPDWIYRAHISDKAAHFIAYLALVFLWWFAVSPYKKASWRKAPVWWTLLVMVWYGVIDELLQAYVGRSADVNDFLADLAGTTAGLALLSILSFWPASIIVTGTIIFVSTNLSRVSLAYLLPPVSAAFHLFAYAFFTILWAQYIQRFLSLRAPRREWLIRVSVLPVGFLSAVKLFSFALARGPTMADVLSAAGGIVVVVATFYFAALRRQRRPG